MTEDAAKMAGFFRRFAASFIDGLLFSLPFCVVQTLLFFLVGDVDFMYSSKETVSQAIFLSTTVAGVWLVAFFLIGVSYQVICLKLWGKTIGKKILGIKVVRADNLELVGYGKAFIRETVGKWLSSWIFNLGYLWMIWDPKKQTWHDKIAGTIVVRDS